MAEERMTLAEAAAHLRIAPNSVRSRWKAGKLRGERDNEQKIWVWLDRSKTANDSTSAEGSKPPSKPSKSKGSKSNFEGFEAFEIKALQNHLAMALEQLGIAQAELVELRPKAVMAERLTAENEGLRGQLAIRADQLEELRRLMAEAKASHAAELQRWMEVQPAKGFFRRLMGR